jgi:hypothetical protein
VSSPVDAGAIFARAQAGLGRTSALHVRVSVRGLFLERSATVQTSQLPLGDFHIVRWVRNPQAYDCGDGQECARAELDVSAAYRDLRPVLPELPIDPRSVRDATVDVMVADDGSFRSARLAGQFAGAGVEVAITPAPS